MTASHALFTAFTTALPVAAQSWATAAGNHAGDVMTSPMSTIHETKKPSGDLRRISATPSTG
jgi:hypothetical protein